MSFPALEFLADHDTEVWVPRSVVPLIHFARSVRSISSTGLDRLGIGDIEPDPALVETLSGFERIISWYGSNRPEFRDALSAINANTTFLTALPPAGHKGHATDYYLSQVGAPLGSVPRIRVHPCQPRGMTVVHPLSGSPRKNWPAENFKALAEKLPIEWLVGPEQDWEGATRFDDLGELASWLTGARLYIGNDSGITHLAAAVGTPVIAIFEASDPTVWAPRGNVTVLQNPTVAAVIEAIGSLI